MVLEHPGTSGGVVEGPCLGGRIELGIREDLIQHQGSDGKEREKYRNTMIHVTVTVLLLMVVNEVFGFVKAF